MRTSEKPDLRKFVDEVLIKKRNSPKFAVAISDVSSPMKPPSCRVERDHPRSPPHVATNGARKRSKLLRLATGRLPENFGGQCELRHNGVLRSSVHSWCSDVFCAMAHIHSPRTRVCC